MEDQPAKDKKTRLVLIILLVVAVVGLAGYLVIGSSDSEPEPPAAQATPAEDGAPAAEEANNAETDPTLVEAQAIIDGLKGIDQSFKAATETCDQTAVDNAKLAGDDILARLEALRVAVTNPTPAHDDFAKPDQRSIRS